MDFIDRLIAREGGYANDKDDRGGETMYGITRKRHPEMFKTGLPTLAQARGFYLTRYYEAYNIHLLPEPLNEQVFDYGVNSGPILAIQKLQEVLGVEPDGVIGEQTLTAAGLLDLRIANNQLVTKRIQMLARLVQRNPSQVKFIFGWVTRALEFIV